MIALDWANDHDYHLGGYRKYSPNREFYTAKCLNYQRKLLNMAHKLAGKCSLIPGSRSYVQHLRIYEGHTNQADLSRMHGLRHAYAQHRYEELTRWASPAADGPTFAQLIAHQRDVDLAAQFTISKELGHEREQVTAVQLGARQPDGSLRLISCAFVSLSQFAQHERAAPQYRLLKDPLGQRTYSMSCFCMTIVFYFDQYISDFSYRNRMHRYLAK